MKMRPRHFRRKRSKPGTAPGTLTPAQDAAPTSLHIMAYGPDSFTEADLKSPQEIKTYIGKYPLIWVNVDGLCDTKAIAEIGEIFNLHPLALEDTVSTHQRPKTEDYGDVIFVVCRMLNKCVGHDLDLEQISLFLGKGFVVSFQERPGDNWNPVRDRIRRGVGKRIRTSGADYLMYALLDSIIDDYFPVLEQFGDHLDEIEEETLSNPQQSVMIKIQSTKHALYAIRHAIWPLREAVNQIGMQDELVTADTKVFIRDCQDHVIQLLDIIESYRERTSGLVDIYLSSLSNRMNEVMKVLAIITTIFMPLTFIAGIYGMNFDNMPELHSPLGYPIIMGLMAVIAVGMVIAFRRIGWLGGTSKKIRKPFIKSFGYYRSE